MIAIKNKQISTKQKKLLRDILKKEKHFYKECIQIMESFEGLFYDAEFFSDGEHSLEEYIQCMELYRPRNNLQKIFMEMFVGALKSGAGFPAGYKKGSRYKDGK